MTAREYFEQARAAAIDRERVMQLHGNLTGREGLQSVSYDGNGGGCGVSDPMKATDIRIDFEQTMQERLAADDATLDEAFVLLYGADGRGGVYKVIGSKYADVLCGYYLYLDSWSELADTLNYDSRYLRNIRDIALAKIDEIGFAALKEQV